MSHTTLAQGLYGSHDAFDECLFSYPSKVNLGGKAVYWTQTLSQDSCSRNEPMHHAHLFPLLLPLTSVLPISLTGLYNVMKKMQNTGEPMPNFFLSVGLHVFWIFFDQG